MKHPSSKAVLSVIDAFKSVIHLAVCDWQLDMWSTIVNHEGTRFVPDSNHHICGTPHCHGGWYAIARCDLSKPVDHTHGATQMAKDLGFSDRLYLEHWAFDNRENVWGNSYGGDMFISRYAFQHETKRFSGAENLQHIIDHWTEVYERLMILENQVEISEPPITSEQLIDLLEIKADVMMQFSNS